MGMASAAIISASAIQASHRCQTVSSPRLNLRLVRPSLLDLRFNGDSWVVDQGEESFKLCLGDYHLASIRGVALDLPSFNRLLDEARHRRPRWRL
jgi:hypothetical protein